MRKYIVFILLLGCIALNAQYTDTLWVSPSGNDAAAGDSAHPWKSWQKGFTSALPGNLVYFRDGIWSPDSTEKPSSHSGAFVIFNPAGGMGHNGTYTDTIVFTNYPGETPILDGFVGSQIGYGNVGIDMFGPNYIKVLGLTVRHIRMRNTDDNCAGIGVDNAGKIWLERNTAFDIGGSGYWISGYDTLYAINNDSKYTCDSLDRVHPGGDGDGFTIKSEGTTIDTFKLLVMRGNRAIHASDDAYDISSPKEVDFGNNWAIHTGEMQGGGDGVKVAFSHVYDSRKRKIYNLLSVFNSSAVGWVNLNDATHGIYHEIYNVTSYKDLVTFPSAIGGYNKYTTPENLILKNNLSYKARNLNGPGGLICFPARFFSPDVPDITIGNNNFTWYDEYGACKYDPAYVVTDADFTNLDSVTIMAQLTAPRKPDGSLPDITVLKLAPGSDMIDRGVNVGIAYNGSAPDLGAFETGGAANVAVTGVTVTGTTTITTLDGTTQLTATIEPENASVKAVLWTVTNGTGTATISQSGLVTALTNGTVTVRATATDGSGVYGTRVITISNQDPLSNATDILTFYIASQKRAATINATNHTVNIEVRYGTDLASLTPFITLSAGATINPISGTNRNFLTSQTYTVTAEDGTTTQVWTVNVTEQDPPAPSETRFGIVSGRFARN